MSFTDELKKLDSLEEQKKIELKRQKELAEAEKKRHEENIDRLKGWLPGLFRAARTYGFLDEGSHDFCVFYDISLEAHGIVLCSENELHMMKKDETLTGIVKKPYSVDFMKHSVSPSQLGYRVGSEYSTDDMLSALRELGFNNVSMKEVKCKYKTQSSFWALLGEKTTFTVTVPLYHIEF